MENRWRTGGKQIENQGGDGGRNDTQHSIIVFLSRTFIAIVVHYSFGFFRLLVRLIFVFSRLSLGVHSVSYLQIQEGRDGGRDRRGVGPGVHRRTAAKLSRSSPLRPSFEAVGVAKVESGNLVTGNNERRVRSVLCLSADRRPRLDRANLRNVETTTIMAVVTSSHHGHSSTSS